jgi:hypothetical protein
MLHTLAFIIGTQLEVTFDKRKRNLSPVSAFLPISGRLAVDNEIP